MKAVTLCVLALLLVAAGLLGLRMRPQSRAVALPRPEIVEPLPSTPATRIASPRPAESPTAPAGPRLTGSPRESWGHGVMLFSARQAEEAKLTAEQQTRIRDLGWDARRKLNEALAATGSVKTLGPNERLFLAVLDRGVAQRLKADFYSALNAELGADTFKRIEAAGIPAVIDTRLDHWGEYALAFRIDVPESQNPAATVVVDRTTDRDLKTEIKLRFPRVTFEHVYGPVAEKVLAGL